MIRERLPPSRWALMHSGLSQYQLQVCTPSVMRDSPSSLPPARIFPRAPGRWWRRT